MARTHHIVYLYSEVMPYTIAVMRMLVKEHGMAVSCIWWDEKKRTPFVPRDESGITFYQRSGFNEEALFKFLDDLNPAIIYVVGRMDKLYMKAARYMRHKSIIVTGSDNQWLGNKKQLIGTLLSPFLYKRYFQYFWVPGKRQYEFARKMGYPPERIINNLLSSDTTIFNNAYHSYKEPKSNPYPHTFVFAGRFSKEKGLDLLISAFTEIKQESQNNWGLVLVGAGDMSLDDSTDIEVKKFMTGEELAVNSGQWGIFCLPSLYEPWGVVVHEFAGAGLPFICSRSVGAADTFVIEGENGCIFNTGDKDSLKIALKKMIAKTDDELYAMSEKSYELSKQISPSIAAQSLMSVLNNNMKK